jgi:hypothetical protein
MKRSGPSFGIPISDLHVLSPFVGFLREEAQREVSNASRCVALQVG